jgi:hypothetical protein
MIFDIDCEKYLPGVYLAPLHNMTLAIMEFNKIKSKEFCGIEASQYAVEVSNTLCFFINGQNSFEYINSLDQVLRHILNSAIISNKNISLIFVINGTAAIRENEIFESYVSNELMTIWNDLANEV